MSEDRRKLLLEELGKKFEGGIPDYAIGVYDTLEEDELEEMLEVDQIPFKSNTHYDSYIKDIKNNDYYKELLVDYRSGVNLTDKQKRTAILVEKVLNRANKDPEYLNKDLSSAFTKEEKVEQNRRFRRASNDGLSEYKNVDAQIAIDIAEEDESVEVHDVVPEDYKVGTNNQ